MPLAAKCTTMQVDEEAPIRANTTILLGNLAKHLSEATCKRVLLNAFTRALKDTFPPARTAGLKVGYHAQSENSVEVWGLFRVARIAIALISLVHSQSLCLNQWNPMNVSYAESCLCVRPIQGISLPASAANDRCPKFKLFLCIISAARSSL